MRKSILFSSLLTAVFVVVATVAMAAPNTLLYQNDFESYADNAALIADMDTDTLDYATYGSGLWTYTTTTLDLQSVYINSDDAGILTNHFTAASTTADTLTVSYWLYDSNGQGGGSTNGRTGLTLASYSNGVYGSGTLEGKVFLGPYHGTSTQYYVARSAYGSQYSGSSGYQATTAARSVGWHKFTMVLHAGVVNFYVDNNLEPAATDTYTEPTDGWNSFAIGSLAGAGLDNIWVDNVLVATDQEVTVDPSNATPDHVTTFDSLAEAISSFQASGDVTSGTLGSGVGVNHGTPSRDVINVVNTGGKIDEYVDPVGPGIVLDEDLIINGQGAIDNLTPVPPTAANNSVIALQAGAAGWAYSEFYQDVNITLNNLTFIPSQTGPDGSTLVRFANNSNNFTSMAANSCIFTTYNASGDPVVTSKADAYTSHITSIATPSGRLDDLIYNYGWGGFDLTLKDCVLSHTLHDASDTVSAGAHDGLVQSVGPASSTYPCKTQIISSVLTYCNRYGIQVYDGNYTNNQIYAQVLITGDGVTSGPINGIGGPSVLCDNGRGIQFFNRGSTSSSRYPKYILIQQAIVADNFERQVSMASQCNVNFDHSLVYGPVPFVIDSNSNSGQTTWTDTTFAGPTGIFGDPNALTPLAAISDCVFYEPTGANQWSTTIYSGQYSVTLDYCGIGQAVALKDVDPGTQVGTGVFYADPMFVSTDWHSPDFLDVQNTAYAGANSTGGDLAGGADYVGGMAPALVSVTPSSYDFGSQFGNTLTTTTLTVQNDATVGAANLMVALGISGTDASSFSVESPATTILIIPAGGIATAVDAVVGFSPQAPGALTANFDAANPSIGATAVLTANGVPPAEVRDWTLF